MAREVLAAIARSGRDPEGARGLGLYADVPVLTAARSLSRQEEMEFGWRPERRPQGHGSKGPPGRGGWGRTRAEAETGEQRRRAGSGKALTRVPEGRSCRGRFRAARNCSLFFLRASWIH